MRKGNLRRIKKLEESSSSILNDEELLFIKNYENEPGKYIGQESKYFLLCFKLSGKKYIDIVLAAMEYNRVVQAKTGGLNEK